MNGTQNTGPLLTSQAHSGVFHMLPLGRRVQDKLEALIDKYMYQLGETSILHQSMSADNNKAPPNWLCLPFRQSRCGQKVGV